MRAVTVVPGKSGSLELSEVAEPEVESGSVVVESLAVGVCGTDAEIAAGQYGWAPPGRDRLVLGHESLGRVVRAGARGPAVGDHVVGIVRMPDPEPCPNCAVGEWDMCSNGRYTEHGIKEHDGFMADRWRSDPDYLVKVDPELGVVGVLLEPASVVAKAWEHLVAIGHRTFWDPHVVLVVGAGPIGLLAALLGRQRGFEVHVLDRVTAGPKPRLVEALGAQYHTGAVNDLGLNPDIVVECTGVPALIRQSAEVVAAGGLVCLTGVGSLTGGSAGGIEDGLATSAVLRNLAVFGSVNANRRHYYLAARELARADRGWLEGLVTRRVAPHDIHQALDREQNDIKVIVDFTS
ncbi:glucose 1-dehydrogenase [Streptomyces sp. NPDC020681]|uniref:glucose 1-dehydrogenase n=1 Tax=Streptomyces sp. NPDC020681 TaxID=3365083 RepID=UPI0037B81E6A